MGNVWMVAGLEQEDQKMQKRCSYSCDRLGLPRQPQCSAARAGDSDAEVSAAAAVAQP